MNYVVKPGDTLWIIANKFNTTVDELIRANPQIQNPNLIFPGEVIHIPGHGPTPVHCPILRQGDRGPAVVRLQELLIASGFHPGAVDGIFGPKTEAAVLAFQASRGLVQDGIVGPMTWGALGADCNPHPMPPNNCPILEIGAQGPDVVRLQQLLLSHGFSPGNIDGIFGPKTQAAVIAFQRSRGLVQDGIVGPKTWTALGVNCHSHPMPPNPCPTLSIGAQGPEVVRLQQLLLSHGFSPGNIDGIFGPKTQAAVLAFQGSRGLVQDGIVGPKTWTALGVDCHQHPIPPCPPTPPCPPQPCPTLQMGDTGPAVVKLQELLMANGFNPGNIDGIFGPKTNGAVVAFQMSRCLVPDGVVGPETWMALGAMC